MNILKEDLSKLNIYWPAKNEMVISLDFAIPANLDSKAFIAYWPDETFGYPFIHDNELMNVWLKYFEENFDYNMDMDILRERLIQFLTNYEAPDWVVIEHEPAANVFSSDDEKFWVVVRNDTVFTARKQTIQVTNLN